MARRNNCPRLARQRHHHRLRLKLGGSSQRPRLCVFRSLVHIYAQVIDDSQGHTLVAASTLDPVLRAEVKDKSRVESAGLVGALVARRAMEKGVRKVVFDRGGYKYHGRVEALAESARETGLVF